MIAILMLLGTGSLSDAEFARIEARLAAFDRVRLHYRHSIRWTPGDENPLDPSSWRMPDVLSDHDYVLTLVRPAALNAFMTDAPAVGFAPVDESVSGGRYVSRLVLPDRDGYAHYALDPRVQSGTFLWNPILQVVDLQLVDAPLPGLNVAGLLRSHRPALVRREGGVSTFAARVVSAEQGVTHSYEVDVDPRGTVRRLKTTLVFENGAPAAVREMFVRAVETVNGVDVPTDIVFVLHNPSIGEHYTIDHIQVSLCEADATLTPADAAIVVEKRLARVSHNSTNGETRRETFDAQGELITTDRWLSAAAPESATPATISTSIQAAALPAASAAGIGTLAVLAMRRRSAVR